MSGQKPYLCTWGEAGTVKVKTQLTGKLKDCGVQCMMVQYAQDHKGDVYHMWDPLTNGIHETCNIIWLHHMLYEKTKLTFKVMAPIEIDPINDMEQEGAFEVREGENQDEDKDAVADTEPANREEEEEEVLKEVQGGGETTTRSG